MKTKLPIFLVAVLIFSPIAYAQRRGGGAGGSPGGNSSPASSQPASSPATAPASSGAAQPSTATANLGGNDKGFELADKILNSDSLNVDTENGVFSWNNSKFDIGNNLIVRSRFERYLSSPGYPDTDKTYQVVLKQIEDLLSNDPGASGNFTDAQKNDRVYQAWQLLGEAAKYPEDGGASETLANQVFNAWRVRDELSSNRAQYEALQNKEKYQKEDVNTDSTGVVQAAQSAMHDHGLSSMEQAVMAQGGTMVGMTVNSPSKSSSSGNSTNSNTNTTGRTTTSNPNGTTSDSTNNSTNGLLNNGFTNSQTGASPGGGGSGGSSSPSSGATNSTTQPASVGMTTATFHAADLARTYVMENLLDADATSMGVQAKLQYQTQLLAYLAQRRFQHSLIAGQFYEHLFKGSQQRVNVAQDEISRYINSDNIVPSVNNFEFISHEAIADVDTSMKAVETAYDAGDRWTALQQLQQTFLLGEMLPPVQQFDAAKRKVLLNIYREANDLRHMMEVHDFAGSEDALKKLQAEAPDFEAAPVISAIKEGEQTSNNYVLAASQAAMAVNADRASLAANPTDPTTQDAVSRDTQSVTDNLQKAGEMWPLNPEIAKFSQNMLDRSNIKDVGGKKFDDLLAQHDDRGIYENRDEIGLAVYQDPARSAQLKDILNKMGQVEMAIAFSDQALKQNNGYAAWEALQSAADIEPNDPVLARSMRTVAPRVPNFVSALDSADRAAKAGNYASALNFYLQAQDIYPASHICSDAIADLSAKLMAKLNPKSVSQKSLAEKNQAADPDANPVAKPEAASPNT